MKSPLQSSDFVSVDPPALPPHSFVDHIYTHCVCCIDPPRHQLGAFNACILEVRLLSGESLRPVCRLPPQKATLFTDIEDVYPSSLWVQSVIRLFMLLKCSKNTSVHVEKKKKICLCVFIVSPQRKLAPLINEMYFFHTFSKGISWNGNWIQVSENEKHGILCWSVNMLSSPHHLLNTPNAV